MELYRPNHALLHTRIKIAFPVARGGRVGGVFVFGVSGRCGGGGGGYMGCWYWYWDWDFGFRGGGGGGGGGGGVVLVGVGYSGMVQLTVGRRGMGV
jgi:hypothetical protein